MWFKVYEINIFLKLKVNEYEIYIIKYIDYSIKYNVNLILEKLSIGIGLFFRIISTLFFLK